MPIRDLASDNYSPVHPAVIDAILQANHDHVISYGADPTTERLRDTVRDLFGDQCAVYPVLTGTAANVMSVTAATPKWGAVVASSHCHMISEEGGAAARLSGIPIFAVPSEDGCITPEQLAAIDWKDGFVHTPQATTLSIADTTELGTVYTPDRVAALCEWAHGRGMLVHLDGARIFNAAAAADCSLADLTTGAGVDVFSIGATKNGGMGAEAVVVANPDIAGADYAQKYLMQLPSKARFVSAQIQALLDDDLGLSLARHSNAMAALLESEVRHASDTGLLPRVEFTQPTESNQLFLRLPHQVAERLRQTVRFYDWDTTRDEVRWVTSFDVTEDDVRTWVDALVDAWS